MLQQITGQIAQQAPPLPITKQEITEQAASKPEPQVRLDITKEEAEGGATKPPSDEKKGQVAKRTDVESSGRYLSFFSSVYH